MKKVLWAAAIAVLLQATAAYADESQMMELLQKMQRQMADMQSTIDRQNARLQQLESSKVIETPQPNAPMAPGAAGLTESDWQKGIKDNIGGADALPWMKGLKFGGDFRLRMENFDYFDKNNDAGSTGTASDRSRNRFRIRLRYGFEKDYGDDWKVGFRMATGSPSTSSGVATDNTSTNVTLGNPGYFVYKNIYIDRAYAQYSPNGLKDYGPLKGVTVGAGKFDNPFLRYSTPIVWDGDVTPEGLYETAKFQLVGEEENKLNLYGTLGQFITNENSTLEQDAGLYGYQGAVNWSTYNFGTETPVDFSFATSYYDYTNWTQTVGAGNTAATSYLRTNTLIADDFRVLDLYPEIAFAVNKTPVVLWYDYATNLANVGTDDIVGSGENDIHDQDGAWGLGLKVGKAKKKGQWEAFYGYYELGANSVVAAFNDSDFGGTGQSGATNRKGSKFGFTYQLTDNIQVNWTGYVVQTLNPNTAVGNSTNEHVFRSQADLLYKF